MKFRHHYLASALVLATTLITMAGCGGNTKNPIYVNEPTEAPQPTAAPTTAPVATPTPAPKPSTPDVPGVTGNLMARLQNFQVTGAVSRTQIATVEVSNPTTATLSGQLTCTFDSTKANATQTKNVSLTPNQTTTFTFELAYTSYSAGVFDKPGQPKIEIRTIAPQSATGFSGSTNFGY